MDLVVNPRIQEDGIKKILFQQKRPRQDGLFLRVLQETVKNQCSYDPRRFVNCAFNCTDDLVACLNNDGQVFVIDLGGSNYWALPHFDGPTCMQFSRLCANVLYIGLKGGDILMVDVQRCCILDQLVGHNEAVLTISLASDDVCVSSSESEGIIWDLRTRKKRQVLQMPCKFKLRFVSVMPLSNNIIACSTDDAIKIWRNESLTPIKVIDPDEWNNHTVRGVTYSNNNAFMLIVCYLPTIAIFSMQDWKLHKLVSLPDYILTVKQAEILPLQFQWKCSKILIVLSGQGVIYFYDLEYDKVVNKLAGDCEILHFRLPTQKYWMGTVSCRGSINLYDVSQYLESSMVQGRDKDREKVKLRVKMKSYANEIEQLLSKEKLREILREFGEFPEKHRLILWENLLELPMNKKQFKNVSNRVRFVAFPDLTEKYPLESEKYLRGLRNLLNNLVTWCPFFANVTYLPIFVFPFNKVFVNSPMLCFEAVITVLMNWCQFWFEYYPLPPVNILAIVENILYDQDLELLQWFAKNDIKSDLYAWPLLESAFSEVLTAPDWLIFWDHVLTNEISFLLCSVPAYNIIQRNTITTLKTQKDCQYFYHNQNPVDVKKLISKTYHILDTTSQPLHPRQYLKDFKPIKTDDYPIFMDYPKTTVELETNFRTLLAKVENDTKTTEEKLLQQKTQEWQRLLESEKQTIECERKREMEKACMEKILTDQKKICAEHRKLDNLKQTLLETEENLVKNSLHRLQHLKLNNDKLTRSEEELLCTYADLLKHKYKELPDQKILEKQQQDLRKQMQSLKDGTKTKDNLRQLNIATGILTIQDLTKKIESQLMQNADSKKLLELQAEAKALENDVNRLINTIRH